MMRTTGVVATIAIAGLVLSGCSSSSSSSDGKTVITLAGPNQWNSQAGTFGKEWEALVAKFEKAEPDIEVKTTVLPLSSFGDTLSTQLTAGTAPELIFNQIAHTPDQVVSLDKYLSEADPYDSSVKTWGDVFNQNAFSDAQLNEKGNHEWVPFNLVTAGLFFNQDALAKAGVQTPITSIGGLVSACTSLKAAGYTPLAMDGGLLGTGWTAETISSNLLNKYATKLNQYDAAGDPGTAASVTQKSIAKAVLTGDLKATKTPEIAESAKLLKKVFDACATKNWSGVASSSTFVGAQEFLAGKAAMAWGTNFAISSLSDVSWKWSSMPFPSVTTADTPLADGSQARFGAVAGGTSYMIPSTTTGAKLAAAVKFLQFATSPTTNADWVKATNAIPATSDVSTASSGIANLLTGDWAKPRALDMIDIAPKSESGSNPWDGYLLGTKTLDQQLSKLETSWVGAAQEGVKAAGFTESWTKLTP